MLCFTLKNNNNNNNNNNYWTQIQAQQIKKDKRIKTETLTRTLYPSVARLASTTPVEEKGMEDGRLQTLFQGQQMSQPCPATLKVARACLATGQMKEQL